MKRVHSLDAMRGLTVAGMIMVNNGCDPTFTPLLHSTWNGMTPCDLVFPFFLFMVGVSIYISFSRHFEDKGNIKKIFKRVILLFVIGAALHAWNMIVRGGGSYFPERLRACGVLQRIAVCYGFSSLFFVLSKGKFLWRTIIILLTTYTILLIVGHGYSENSTENWIAIIDRKFLGYHMLLKAYYGITPVDPEGILSTTSAVAHTLIGVACGKKLMQGHNFIEKGFALLLTSAIMGIAGYLFSFALPLNKAIWSPTFVLVSCSIAASSLALFAYIFDYRECKWGFSVLQFFGANALFLYIVSQMIPVVFVRYGISDSIYGFWASFFVRIPEIASLCFALTHVLIIALIGFILYWQKTLSKTKV